MSDFVRELIERLDDEDWEEIRRRLGLDIAPARGNRPEPLLTTAEAAALRHVSVETVRRAIRSGALGAVRLGGVYRISYDDLDSWGRPHQADASQTVKAARSGHRRRDGRVMANALQTLGGDA